MLSGVIKKIIILRAQFYAKKRIGEEIANEIADIIFNTVKSRAWQINNSVVEKFTAEFIKTEKVTSIEVVSANRKLTAHKLEIEQDKSQAVSAKKALVYISGSHGYVADIFPRLEKLLLNMSAEDKKNNKNIQYSAFCQDYRGRGFNQEKATENWNDFSFVTDAEDQAAFLRKLMEEGYKSEDILVVGQDYGSLIGIWAFDLLGSPYTNIKFYADRGFGDPLGYPNVKKYLYPEEIETIYKVCTQRKLNPEKIPAHVIAASLTNIFVTRVDKDDVIEEAISLVKAIPENAKPGRLWVLKSVTANPSNEPFETLCALHIPELQAHYFIRALLNEMTIKLSCDLPLNSAINGFQLKRKEATKAQADDFVEFPNIKTVNTDNKNVLYISATTLTKLVLKLIDFCNEQAALAAKSNVGGNYKKGKHLIKDKVRFAVELIKALCEQGEPNLALFNELIEKEKTQKIAYANFNDLYINIINFMEDYERLEKFNASLTLNLKLAQPTLIAIPSPLFFNPKKEEIASTTPTLPPMVAPANFPK